MRSIAILSVLALAGCAKEVRQGESGLIRPFEIRVPEARLADLRERLAAARWPDQIEDSGWTYGPDVAYMRGLVEYWRIRYDWRAAERRLNAFDQFVTTVDGVDLHFIHQRSKHANALPLVLTHGWPGTVAEFQEVIDPLVNPEAHGGTAADAFHVICPSLPGFGFSGKPKEPGWDMNRMADALLVLMDRLGYERYGAQGGDWGRGITERLGRDPRVVGIHLQFPPGSPPAGANPEEGLTAEEIERMKRRRKELADHYGYSSIQGSRPLALAYGLNDSPAGLAAWIVDKFWAWSDHGGDLDSSFTRDQLLTNIMIYWVTETMPSSVRIYYESRHPSGRARAERPVRKDRVPVGVALFPKEIRVPPRKWVERRYNLVHWTEMPRGGHFAALEEPELFVEDVRRFFRKVR